MSREITLDVRGMEAPEPLERVLETIDDFAGDDRLRLIIDCRPMPLFRILERNGYGYREAPGLVAVAALNLGLICRVAAEPFERTGHASDLTLSILGASALLQVSAIVIFVAQLWPRIYGKGKLGKPQAR